MVIYFFHICENSVFFEFFGCQNFQKNLFSKKKKLDRFYPKKIQQVAKIVEGC